jgi:uncharacterized OB-fold protein
MLKEGDQEMRSANGDPAIKPFRAGLFHLTGTNTGYLVGSRCERCKISFFPKRTFCNNCFGHDQINEVELSKTGTLYTYTTAYRSRPNMKAPYNIGFVDLKEGVRIFAQLFDVSPEKLKIGMEVELVFRVMTGVSGEGESLVYGFRPAGKSTPD